MKIKEDIEKVIPQAIELEEAVLGAMMLENDCLKDTMPVLHEGYFYKDAHKRIFHAMQNMFKKGEVVDILTVTNELTKNEQIKSVGGALYISKLTDKVSSSANVEHHINILKAYYLKRNIIQLGSLCLDMGYDMGESPEDSINILENKVAEFNEVMVGVDYEDNISSDIAKRFLHNTAPRKNNITGIPTGNDAMTKLTDGWQKGDLIILSARSSMGKTGRAIDYALYASALDYKVAFFSLEMKKEKIYDRMMLNVSEINSNVVKFQKWEDKNLKEYEAAATWLAKSNIYVNDKTYITPNYVKTVCRQRKRKYGLDLVVIDYLQYMEANDATGYREQDVASISRALKSLAKELEVPVIALCQLNRDLEKRVSKRPILSDLRESGSIEQDADLVIGLYRPSYYWSSKNDDNDYNKENNMTEEEYKMLVETVVLKHRNGELGRVKEYFDTKKCKFYQSYNAPENTVETTLPF